MNQKQELDTNKLISNTQNPDTPQQQVTSYQNDLNTIEQLQQINKKQQEQIQQQLDQFEQNQNQIQQQNQQNTNQQKSNEQQQEQQLQDEDLPMFLKDPEEKKHFIEILLSFYNYQLDTVRDIAKMEKDFNNMDPESKKFLNFNYQDRIQKLKKANTNNYKLVWQFMSDYEFVLTEYLQQNNYPQIILVKPMNISKMRSTLKQLIRDWSVEGQQERDQCYKPVKEQIKNYFKTPVDPETKQKRRVLFPGSGLGRIVFDMATEGYFTQGNEFSYHMLITANFILNYTQEAFQFTIQPHIHNFCNKYNREDPFQEYKIPDINPSQVMDPENHEMSMVAGEFVDIYQQQKGEWDCISTCFFIDTAQNIVRYLMTIYNALKKGGIWVNFGPLQFHYAGMDEMSIELSLDEVKTIAENIGFKFIHESYHDNVTYVGEHKQMLNLSYNCVCLTAVKEKDNYV